MPAHDALIDLHTALIDTRKGYEEAVADSDQPKLTALFRDMLALRERHHTELHKLLHAAGATPDESGSFMSTVHRTVIGVRSAITGLDGNALAAFARGEESIVADYDKAIVEAQGTPEAVATLTRQRGEVSAKIAEIKAMAAA